MYAYKQKKAGVVVVVVVGHYLIERRALTAPIQPP